MQLKQKQIERLRGNRPDTFTPEEWREISTQLKAENPIVRAHAEHYIAIRSDLCLLRRKFRKQAMWGGGFTAIISGLIAIWLVASLNPKVTDTWQHWLSSFGIVVNGWNCFSSCRGVLKALRDKS